MSKITQIQIKNYIINYNDNEFYQENNFFNQVTKKQLISVSRLLKKHYSDMGYHIDYTPRVTDLNNNIIKNIIDKYVINNPYHKSNISKIASQDNYMDTDSDDYDSRFDNDINEYKIQYNNVISEFKSKNSEKDNMKINIKSKIQHYVSNNENNENEFSDKDIFDAKRGYEYFHNLKSGTCNLNDIKSSSCGISGWAKYAINYCDIQDIPNVKIIDINNNLENESDSGLDNLKVQENYDKNITLEINETNCDESETWEKISIDKNEYDEEKAIIKDKEIYDIKKSYEEMRNKTIYFEKAISELHESLVETRNNNQILEEDLETLMTKNNVLDHQNKDLKLKLEKLNEENMEIYKKYEHLKNNILSLGRKLSSHGQEKHKLIKDFVELHDKSQSDINIFYKNFTSKHQQDSE